MILQLLALLAIHWVADFVLQTHWQASNKSKDNIALLQHVGTYGTVLAITTPFLFGGHSVGIGWLIFVWVNVALHFITDYFTSRISSRLYAKQDWHNFFVVVGFDQLIHQATLAGTMVLFLGVPS